MPTYSEYLNAANAIYNLGATPHDGLTPFLDSDGMSYVRASSTSKPRRWNVCHVFLKQYLQKKNALR
jgi:hypothetical protein